MIMERPLRLFLPIVLLFPAVGFSQPIRLHPENGHYLLWRDKPTVLVTSGEHYGAVLNSAFDYRTYLRTLHEDRLNLTRTFTGAYCEPIGAFNIANNTLAPAAGKLLCPWARSETPGYANGGNKFDLTKFDPAWFARVKDFLRMADENGVVVELVLFCPFYKDDMWNLSPMNAANNVNGIGHMDREQVYTLKHPKLLEVQDAMVRKIVTELKDFDNLYYEICNEPYFGGVTLEWQRHIARTIADTEKKLGAGHLIAQNIANGSKQIDDPDPNVSIFNFHYAKPPTAVTVNYDLNRVIGDDETGFAGSGDTVYRVEGWNFILAGGGIYDNLDYSFQVGHEDGAGQIKAPGGGGPAFRDQMRILKDFIHSFDFIHMKPDRLIVSGLPEKASAYALAQPGKAYAVYFSGANGPLDVKFKLPAGDYRLTWVDTRTGNEIQGETVHSNGEAVTIRTPEFKDDIALRIAR